MEAKTYENSTMAFLTENSTVSPKVNPREKIKIEFYKTYDVMTGIRIAATLGGFFSMMILLVLYKNYCKPNKTLSEEQLNAAVTAAAEEEDRALQAALEATSFYTALEKRRESLRNTNQVLLSPRFSSVGGGYSHLTPPLKVMQQRGKSLSGSVMQFHSSHSPSSPFQKNVKTKKCSSKEEIDFYNQQLDYFACKNFLNVPPSRRVSSVTCFSADSTYLERRCSAFELELPSPSHFVRRTQEKFHEEKETYYPIDIQVIQPTPEMSPTASERNLNREQSGCSLQVPAFHDQMHRLSVTNFDFGLAPLASISSLGSFSSQSLSLSLVGKSFHVGNSNVQGNQGCSCGDDSLGSDSVFLDNEEDEEFLTDSEFESNGFDDDYSFCETKPRTDAGPGLWFASFESFDASITQDSNSENMEEDAPKATGEPSEDKFSNKTYLSDFKRHLSLRGESKIKKKIIKTYSEPRSSKAKRLPMWVEKGRSGYVPKRQLSYPTGNKKKSSEESDSNKPNQNSQKLVNKDKNPECGALHEAKVTISQEGENAKDLTKSVLPSYPISQSDSVALTPNTQESEELATSSTKQGINEELPLKNSEQVKLLNAQEKRSRLQKQKNFIEEINEAFATKEKTDLPKVSTDENIKDSSTVSENSELSYILIKDDGELINNYSITREPNEYLPSSDIKSNKNGSQVT